MNNLHNREEKWNSPQNGENYDGKGHNIQNPYVFLVYYLYISWVVDWSIVWPKPLGKKGYIGNIYDTLVEKTKMRKVLDTMLC